MSLGHTGETERLQEKATREKEAAAGGQRIPVTNARSGVMLGTMRYVWAISLVLAVLAMIVVYAIVSH